VILLESHFELASGRTDAFSIEGLTLGWSFSSWSRSCVSPRMEARLSILAVSTLAIVNAASSSCFTRHWV